MDPLRQFWIYTRDQLTCIRSSWPLWSSAWSCGIGWFPLTGSHTSAGHKYSLTYWLFSNGTTPNDFSASFNGTTLFSQVDIPAQSYTEYQDVVTATGSSSTLQFGFRNDPSYLGLDSISVYGRGSSTPEAGTLWGFGFMMSMGGIFAIRRRMKKQVSF